MGAISDSQGDGSKTIPVNPIFFATWLVAASFLDVKESPTETRCVDIAFF